MIKIISTVDGRNTEFETIQPNAWIHLGDPTENEIKRVSTTLDIETSILRAPLDEEETSRLEYEDNVTSIIVDIPRIVPSNNGFAYETVPFGIYITDENIITVCLEEDAIVEDFMYQKVKNFSTANKTRFLLQLLYKIALKYLSILRMIDKASSQLEAVLHKSMANRDLISMLRLNKVLVYFTTSLKANEIVLDKIARSHQIVKTEDDEELLEDVIIENKQAIQMAETYRDILNGTTRTFSSIISNNISGLLKSFMLLVTVIGVPLLIFALFSMNIVNIPLASASFAFPVIAGFALLCIGIISFVHMRNNK